MAFEGAHKRIKKRLQTVLSKNFLTRLSMVFVTVISIASFHYLAKGAIPLLTFFRMVVLPQLREASGTWLTQPLLFLVLNSMIFAILAPSGLFTNAGSSANSSDLAEVRSDVDDVSSSEKCKIDLCKNTQVNVDSAELEVGNSKKLERVGSVDNFQKQPRVRRVRKIRKSQSATTLNQIPLASNRLITMEVLGGHPESATASSSSSPPPSSSTASQTLATCEDNLGLLEDDDFNRRIDAFIAKAREQMRQQEIEFAAAARFMN